MVFAADFHDSAELALFALQIWDVRTTECVRTMLPPQINLVTETACNCICFLPLNRDRMLVCNRTPSLYVMSVSGEVRGCSCVTLVTGPSSGFPVVDAMRGLLSALFALLSGPCNPPVCSC